ncbi:hypothetical protein AXA44_32825 [Rhodococcus sp. SC4]|nr:hypothetical protein AXA44_32825 [Rhodococcus sp. SC4]KXX59263.1 hypothetical protein AZG88_42135 [Rhodococcus sp. LB1]
MPVEEAIRRLDAFCKQRAAAGRGLPERPEWARPCQHAPGGTPEVNESLLVALLGISRTSVNAYGFRDRLERAVSEIGVEPDGMAPGSAPTRIPVGHGVIGSILDRSPPSVAG